MVEPLHLVWLSRRQRPVRSFPRPAALAGSGPDCELRRPEGLCREFQSEWGEVVGTRRLRQDRRIPYLPILAPVRRRRNTTIVQSRGLSCNTDHVHNPYWRFDFDINGNGMDQVFLHDDGGSDKGWGPGWKKYTNERNDVKNLSPIEPGLCVTSRQDMASGSSPAMAMPLSRTMENAMDLPTTISRSAVPSQTRISLGCSEPVASSVMTKTIRVCKNRTLCSGMWLTSHTWPHSARRSGSPLALP